MPTTTPAPYPTHLAQFEVIRRLGAGGMAEVFLARKPGAGGTHKVLVVKRILPTHGASRRFRAMFVEEAQLATRLNHPNVVQVYEFYDGGDEGQLLAMEYVEGPNLGMLMSSAKANGTRIPPWLAAWIVAEAAKGLHYAHEKKDEGGAPLEIVHRDVSPQNVLLSYEGAVKIADFGIASAKLVIEETGILKGKFGYMSPEQARGDLVDRRSDLYALGVVLWECLTGRPAHGGLSGDALLDIVRSGHIEPPSTYVRDMPNEIESIVMKALAPHAADRHQTGRDFANDIARALLLKQELVDAATLESTIALLTPREAVNEKMEHPATKVAGGLRSIPEGDDRSSDVNRHFEGERASAALSATAPPSVLLESPFGSGEKLARDKRFQSGPPAAREVRHVAVVTLRLHGVDRLIANDEALAARTLDRLRTMLDEIAYKRGLHAWIWSSDEEGRAVAGLTANPTRAASDAAWLALDTHESIAGMNEDSPIALSASIGIVRGIAGGSRDAQGNLVRYRLHDPVIYFADVLGRATPRDRTWVAGGVYRLVRREFRWGDAPTLQLTRHAAIDNLPPTMRIYALERSLSREERIEEVQNGPSDLVGRDAEKADLHAAYHAAVSNAIVTTRAVVGEMGIGKTALISAFLNELPPNARLVRVECSPVSMETPVSAIAELVRDAIGTTGDEPFEQVAELIAHAGGGSAQGDASNPMVARLAELATNRQMAGNEDEDLASRRRLLVTGVRHLLAALAMQQPVVVIVESVQWADKQSLELLLEIVRTADSLPILLLLLTRSDERSAALFEGVVRIELRGLTTDEQVRLVETRLGVREGVRQVCADLMPRVGGNPFFLLEMVDALLERGTLEIREAPTQGGERHHVLARTEHAEAGFRSLPSTLEQLLGDRLRELPSEEHKIIEWLAIAGGPLATNDLRALAGDDEEEALVRLCARGLCDRKGEIVDFRHPLTRDVAYIALEASDRVMMHRALGEHLAQSSLGRGLSAAIVARHLARGEAGARAADFYLEAANAARSSYQVALATRYFHRAFAHMVIDDPRRVSAIEALETIYRALGRRRERMRYLEALRKLARQIATPRVTCMALLRTARFNLDEGRLVHGLATTKQASSVAHASSLSAFEVEAESLTSEFLRELGDVQGALAACDRALAACDPNVHPNLPSRARAEVLRARGVLLRRVGRVHEAVDAYVEALGVFKRTGARRLEARAKKHLAFAMFVQGRYEDSIALALEVIQIDLSAGGRFQLANTLTNIGHAYARTGDMPRAQAYLKRAREAHERYGDQDGRADTLIVSSEVMLEMGELERAEEFLGDAAALNAATDNAYDKTHEEVVRAVLVRAQRNPRAAAHHATVARHAAEEQALVSFHFYGLAVEAASRVDSGEMHAATLLATTAIGAVETLQGCEYGLEIRVLCADALKRAGSPQAGYARQLAVDYAATLMNGIRDRRLRRLFAERPIVAALFDATPLPSVPRLQL